MTSEAAAVLHERAAELVTTPRVSERRVAWLFVGTGVALFAAMGLAGLAMRLTQAEVIDLSADWFYRLMTLHGAGMLTGALVAMMGALWFVLRTSVPLSLERMLASFLAILAGAVGVVIAVLVGGFATGWTFLAPLPFFPAGQWSTWATVVFLAGLLLVGVGFMVFCLDVLAKAVATYGGLGRALGIAFLRGRDGDPPPPQAIGAVVVAVEGLLASAAGATIIVALLGRTIDAGMELDALWAKNLTYFFGHSVANLIIYLAAGAIYVLVPRFAGRPWKTTKPIVVAWLATLAIVATAYSHHLYMDFVQPGVLQYLSMTASFAAALPVAVVTVFTGLTLVWGSRYRWTLASTLLYLGFAGWTIGGAGAVIDSLIPANFRFHNTLWVVAHFHTYLLLGVILWALAFLAHLLEQAAGRTGRRGPTALALGGMLVGGYGLVGVWYVSGVLGLPRRYALHPGDTDGYSLAGAIFVMIFALGFLVLLGEFAALGREALARRRAGLVAAEPGPPEPPREAAAPAGVPLVGRAQLGVAYALAAASIVAFLPPVAEASEDGVATHHLAHTGQFLFGSALGLIAASLPGVARRLGFRLPGVAVIAAIGAPAGMLLLMLPRVYGSLEGDAGAHFGYHAGLAALGLAAGLGAGTLGKVPGRLFFLAGIGMALMYAAGAVGG